MRYKQKGSVIIISLVMLVLVTSLGLTGMRVSSLEERMSGNFRDHELAFQAAESALSEAEAWVEKTSFSMTDFQAGCTSGKCFTATCSNGLCFDGSFPTTGAPVSSCNVGLTKPWEDWDLWVDNSKYRTVTSLTGTSSAAKYIVEFRCFMVIAETKNDASTNIISEWAYSYRITALSAGATADSKVMLQSTYKKY